MAVLPRILLHAQLGQKREAFLLYVRQAHVTLDVTQDEIKLFLLLWIPLPWIFDRIIISGEHCLLWGVPAR